ncbi:uncharacterized protein PHACADRAFT_252889 [Phanerochaete carnosa HHB-10118-sp]|uniref:Uncharacterized protein n=1 Tax=Phanerochaete carnosa (strain HHB-10118-sp) TaxID=650164 RepID=K5W3Q6_PHACS|nr:uncharacterized protein PHACADRAFT_252889 [Phanerochaete carnosa HHB-10118-sp]EKM58508.1 hypothetical protein PHACADRAFT_252889 [Phanerochaete carnosa HHB-10118-sp]
MGKLCTRRRGILLGDLPSSPTFQPQALQASKSQVSTLPYGDGTRRLVRDGASGCRVGGCKECEQ